MTHPNLFLVGPPRSATTSLAYWLNLHPEITISRPKEPGYHIHELPMAGRISDREEYLRLFAEAGDKPLRGDATPWYLFARSAPESIYEMSPDAEIIVGLRNPVDLVVSLHNHHRYVGFDSDSHLENALLRPRGSPDPTDFRIDIDLVHAARVGEQVARYFALFPPQQIHPVRFDQLVNDPASVFPDLVSALGVTRLDLPQYSQLNPARRRRSLTAQRVLEAVTKPVAGTRWGNGLRNRLSRANTVRVQLEPTRQVRDQIMGELADDIRLLEQLVGVDLSSWYRESGV